jgi:hypothetical protein
LTKRNFSLLCVNKSKSKVEMTVLSQVAQIWHTHPAVRCAVLSQALGFAAMVGVNFTPYALTGKTAGYYEQQASKHTSAVISKTSSGAGWMMNKVGIFPIKPYAGKMPSP